MGIEGDFVLEAWGHKFYGLKDVQNLDRVIPENELSDAKRGQRVPLVLDHKTTGDLKWAKRPAELVTDPQAVIYAAHAMVSAGVDTVDLRWVYYKRPPRSKAQVTDVRVTRDDIAPTLAQIKVWADEMAAIKVSGKKALDLIPNPSACGAFGGCPYVSHCNLSPREMVLSMMTQPGQAQGSVDQRKNDFLATIRGAQAAGQAPTGAINPPQNQAPPQGQPPQNWTPPPQNQGQPPAQGQAPWQPQPAFTQMGGQPPPQGQPPAQPVWGPPDIIAQAQAIHNGWIPGQQWWNGTIWIPPGEQGYPPVSQVMPGGMGSGQPPAQTQAPQGQPPAQEQTPPARRGRKKKDQTAAATGAGEEEPQDLAEKALTMIGNGFLLLASAVAQGLWG
jgi:hypothetical protein